ncbi:MAG: V-type ATP synthase subunit K [Firmicutes bacterium]|nr:V-type ATP synthase subunit K [Bacillota bacterium]
MILTMGIAWGFLGAAIAVAGAGIGSSIGAGRIGAFSTGVVAERPELFARALIIQLFPSTQIIYGLLISFLILLDIGVIGGSDDIYISTEQGIAYAFAALPVGILGFASAAAQGGAGQGAVAMIAKNPAFMGRAFIKVALIETFAIFGLLISFLLVNAVSGSEPYIPYVPTLPIYPTP